MNNPYNLRHSLIKKKNEIYLNNFCIFQTLTKLRCDKPRTHVIGSNGNLATTLPSKLKITIKLIQINYFIFLYI